MDDRTVRALLGVVGLYAAATAACYAFLRWYRPAQLDDVTLAAGLLGLPLAASIGSLWGSRGYFQEARLILRSVAEPSLEDASPGERMGSLAEPLSTESDSFGDDICADDAHLHLERGRGAELRKLRILERRLHAGEAVCAAGVYSAAKKALVPSGAGSKPLRISTYGPEIWAADNRGWGRTCILWGVGLGIFSIGCALATRWC